MLKNLFRFSFLPASADCGLLLLRLWFGITLFWRHGLDKVTHYSQYAQHFPDPISIGSHPSLMLAMFAETVCAALLILGLGTRFAALVIIIDLGVAFIRVHHFAFHGPMSGELPFLFLGFAATLFLAGPGRHSVDRG
jgi:putative oxidoreductase